MCNEAVTWTVFETPIKISSSQAEELTKWPAGYLSGNNRSPLPLNGRKVSYYGLNEDVEADVVPDSDYNDISDEADNGNSTDFTDNASNDTDATSARPPPVEDESSSSSNTNTFTLLTFFATVLLLI